MSQTIEVKVPDIGNFEEVEVIEVLVKVGDEVKEEQSLITVESDKASMEIPSSAGGVVKAVKVKLGDKVSEGTPIVELEAAEGAQAQAAAAPATGAAAAAASSASGPAAVSAPAGVAAPSGEPARAGETARAGASAPASAAPATPAASAAEPAAGTQAEAVPARSPGDGGAASPAGAGAAAGLSRRVLPTAALGEYAESMVVKPHASPSVRKFARELGVDLAQVQGSGPKQRILHDDVRDFVKGVMRRGGAAAAAAPAGGDAGAALGLIPWPKVDFAKFGPVEARPVARIRRISAANLHRNWVMIPHVTNHEDADITELEAFRLQTNRENEKQGGAKLTMLAFLIKACVATLQKFPEFNASLEGENMVLKRYWHIGFAADTPNGLVVPVIRDADTKGVLQIARETAELAAKAREGKLAPADMQGGTFSISSLGGIGGTYFTPIINAPEVAILGVCRSVMRPVWDGKEFQPRLILPLSLSWDHRAVDGAGAARFNAHLSQLLADFRRVML
ncbi:MAG: dihydrolipoamide acetyltransferase [Burkholderiales bacterium 70-64]|nr:MAG: dihydrolipoamide acetyltransferase [Burkholderiales bacterium 70-64]